MKSITVEILDGAQAFVVRTIYNNPIGHQYDGYYVDKVFVDWEGAIDHIHNSVSEYKLKEETIKKEAG